MNPLHAFITGVIPAGYLLLFFKIVMFDELDYFVSPRMHIFMYIGIGILLVMTVLHFFYLSREKKERLSQFQCDCGPAKDKKFGWKRWGVYALFAGPLLIGFLIPPEYLDSSFAHNRMLANVDGSASGGMDSFREADIHIPHELHLNEQNFVSLLTNYQYYEEEFHGRDISLAGFVSTHDDLEDNHVFVLRYAVNCCIADATPVGVIVDIGESEVSDDDWVSLSGTVVNNHDFGYSFAEIEVSEWELLDHEEEYYLYPSSGGTAE